MTSKQSVSSQKDGVKTSQIQQKSAEEEAKLSMAQKLVGVEFQTPLKKSKSGYPGSKTGNEPPTLRVTPLSGGNGGQASPSENTGIRSWFQKKFWRQWLAFGSGFVAILLITLTLLFGWDQAWWRTSFDGKINLPAGQSSITATVEFQNQTVEANPDGSFRFENVQFGQHPIRISAQNFEPLEKTVTVNRFGGFSYFSLTFVDFSSVQFQLSVEENQPLLRDELRIFIGDTELDLNDSNFAAAGNIPMDEEYLSIESPFYADRRIPLNLRPGENLLPEITLQPAIDIQLTTHNWLNEEEKMEGVSITTDSDEVTTDEAGQATLRDIPVSQPTIKITANTEGFTLLETEISTASNQQKIEMVPAGSVVFVTEQNGRRDIYKSHLDGSNATPLVRDFGSVSWFDRVGDRVLFQSDGETLTAPNSGDRHAQYFQISLNGGQSSRISRWYQYWSQPPFWFESVFSPYAEAQVTRVSSDNYSRTQLKIADGFGQNERNLVEYEKSGYMISPSNITLSRDGQKIAFNLQTSKNVPYSTPPQEHLHRLHTINADGSNFAEFFSMQVNQGYPEIVGFSADSSHIFYTVEQGSQTRIIRRNLSSGAEQTFSDSLPVRGTFVIENSDLYFASTRDGKSDVYRILGNSSEVEKLTETGSVTHFTLSPENSALLFATLEGNFVRSLTPFNDKLPQPIRTEISTNYTGWISTVPDPRW